MVTPVGFSSSATDGNPAGVAVLASAGLSPVVVVRGCRQGNTGTFSVQTPTFAVTAGLSPSRLSGTIYNGSPLDHTVDVSDGGDCNVLFAVYVELR
jgi:hypothetical protein